MAKRFYRGVFSTAWRSAEQEDAFCFLYVFDRFCYPFIQFFGWFSLTRIMNRFRTRIGPWVPDCGRRKTFPVTFFWLTQSSVLGIFSGLVSIVCAESDFCFTFRLFQLIKIPFITGRRCQPIRADIKMNLKTNFSSLSTFLGFETVFF